MTIQQKRLQYLEKTINHFNSTNRAVLIENGYKKGCLYSHQYNGGCAIGREIPQELAIQLDDYKAGAGVSNPNIFAKLPDYLKELGQQFLIDLQRLHDGCKNWCKTGLSKAGKLRAAEIKRNYCI